MLRILKRLASHLPLWYQQQLKRLHYGCRIRRGRFKPDETEFLVLDKWVAPGDWVLDIGANVGLYTKRLSELVGATGRVFAFEPVPQSFELLAANMSLLPLQNVTLLNIAASEATKVLGMSIPDFDNGLKNYYKARLTVERSELSVLCLAVDSLHIPESIKLAKIDAEGHELSVLKGMENLIECDHPVLIVEGHSREVASYLERFGYSFEETEGSRNRVFQYVGKPCPLCC